MSKTSTNTILTAFNDHFMEFVNDIQQVFPDDPDILSTKNAFVTIRKINPKLFIRVWSEYVVGKYRSEIEAGNIDYFINKDYTDDVIDSPNSKKIIMGIDRLRNPVKEMNEENKKKSMQYIQNLTKLCTLYSNLNGGF
jgi:hypothetical protein